MADHPRQLPPPPECTSPPCYAHEVDPAYMGLDNEPDPPEDQPAGEQQHQQDQQEQPKAGKS